MNLQDFFNKYNGLAIDFDGYFGAQCVDEVQQYNKEVIGGPFLSGASAKDIATTYPKDFYDWIPNTPDNFPEAGDVPIWGVGIGPDGHIAVCKEGNKDTFTSLDQNWNGVMHCQFVTHNYNGVLGWLRPKQQTQPTEDTQKILDDLRTARDSNWQSFQSEIAKNAELSNQISDLTKKVSDLEGQVSILDAKTTELQKEVDAAKQEAANYLSQLSDKNKEDSASIQTGLDAQYKLKELQASANQWKDALSAQSISDQDMLSAIDSLHNQVRAKELEKQSLLKGAEELFSLLINKFVGRKK